MRDLRQQGYNAEKASVVVARVTQGRNREGEMIKEQQK